MSSHDPLSTWSVEQSRDAACAGRPGSTGRSSTKAGLDFVRLPREQARGSGTSTDSRRRARQQPAVPQLWENRAQDPQAAHASVQGVRHRHGPRRCRCEDRCSTRARTNSTARARAGWRMHQLVRQRSRIPSPTPTVTRFRTAQESSLAHRICTARGACRDQVREIGGRPTVRRLGAPMRLSIAPDQRGGPHSRPRGPHTAPASSARVCGLPAPKPFHQRVHRCQGCGLVEDRDVAAARVVANRAAHMLNGSGESRVEDAPVGAPMKPNPVVSRAVREGWESSLVGGVFARIPHPRAPRILSTLRVARALIETLVKHAVLRLRWFVENDHVPAHLRRGDLSGFEATLALSLGFRLDVVFHALGGLARLAGPSEEQDADRRRVRVLRVGEGPNGSVLLACLTSKTITDRRLPSGVGVARQVARRSVP